MTEELDHVREARKAADALVEYLDTDTDCDGLSCGKLCNLVLELSHQVYRLANDVVDLVETHEMQDL